MPPTDVMRDILSEHARTHELPEPVRVPMPIALNGPRSFSTRSIAKCRCSRTFSIRTWWCLETC